MDFGWLSTWIAGIAIVSYLFYKWTTKGHDYFQKRGIPYRKPFLFLGSSTDFWFSKKTMSDLFISIYSEFDGEQ